MGEVVTRDYLRRELEELRDLLAELVPPADTDRANPSKADVGERRSKRGG